MLLSSSCESPKLWSMHGADNFIILSFVLQQMLLLISLRESEFRKDGLDSASSYPDPQFSSEKNRIYCSKAKAIPYRYGKIREIGRAHV